MLALSAAPVPTTCASGVGGNEFTCGTPRSAAMFRAANSVAAGSPPKYFVTGGSSGGEGGGDGGDGGGDVRPNATPT
jgi:hypothetical protein